MLLLTPSFPTRLLRGLPSVKLSFSWDIAGRDGRTGFERVGDAVLPRRFTARFEFPEDHDVELEIGVEGGTPVCESIRIVRNPGRPSLTGAEMKRLPLANWIAMAATGVAMTRTEDAFPPGVTGWEPASEGDQEHIFADVEKRQRRRVIDDSLLRDVARVYRANVDTGAPTDAVREQFHVAGSTAARYVKLARQAGHLGESTPGKAGER